MAEIVLEDTDTISVVYGQGEPVAEYATHPRVQWVPVNGRSHTELVNAIAPTSRFIVLGERISQQLYQYIAAEAKRRHGQMLHKGNTGAIRTMLRIIFPAEPAPELVPPTSPPATSHDEGKPKYQRGFVQAFLDTHPFDATKSASDEGRRLFAIAQAEGITTTLASITQAILVRKKKATAPPRQEAPTPKPEPWTRRSAAKPRQVSNATLAKAVGQARGRGRLPANGHESGVKLLDDAMRAMGALRAWIINTQKQNKELQARMDQIEKVKRQLGW
jgi:hypothetical protein